MFCFLVIAVVCASFVCVLGTELYPDLRCHMGYDNRTNSLEEAIGRVMQVMKECKEGGEWECYKTCIMWRHGMLESGDGKLYLTDEGKHYMMNLLFPNQESAPAEKLFKKIYSSCKDKTAKYSDPCTSPMKLALYSCIEKAWAC